MGLFYTQLSVPLFKVLSILYCLRIGVWLIPCFFLNQVIVEKAPKARIGDLDKKKYLVPSDLTGNWSEGQQSDGHS